MHRTAHTLSITPAHTPSNHKLMHSASYRLYTRIITLTLLTPQPVIMWLTCITRPYRAYPMPIYCWSRAYTLHITRPYTAVYNALIHSARYCSYKCILQRIIQLIQPWTIPIITYSTLLSLSPFSHSPACWGTPPGPAWACHPAHPGRWRSAAQHARNHHRGRTKQKKNIITNGSHKMKHCK